MWTQENYLLADLVDALQINTWVTANKGAKESEQSSKPTPIQRPSDIRGEEQKAIKAADTARKFQARFGHRRPPRNDSKDV